MQKKQRLALINSGILGHASVHRLLIEGLAQIPDLECHSVDLSRELTVSERVVRKLICLRPPALIASRIRNLDFARWRHEFHCGLLARKRIRDLERRVGALDFLHFHPQATAYCSLARMATTPSIVSIDATSSLAGIRRSRLEQATYSANIVWDRRVFRAATAIVSTSQWAANDLLRQLPEVSPKLQVLPYPVRLGEFCASWIAERFDRRHRGKPRFLFVGGDFPRKGGKALLEAWRQASLGNVAELTLVTDWPLDEKKLPSGVEWVRGVRAYTPEWRELWRRADVFVLPTRDEAFGMVFQEAAAAGLPAIGTSISAIPEIIRPNETGLLIAVDHTEALVNSIQAFAGSADLRRSYGERARRLMEAAGSPEKYASKLIQLLESAHTAARPLTNSTARKV